MKKSYNLLYKGRKIYQNLTLEDCSEILQDFSERFYTEENVDPNEIEMEEIVNSYSIVTGKQIGRAHV